VIKTKPAGPGIDTPEDLKAAEKFLAKR
jgi:CMP-2-keto-3-deoxyoctulosonic acid synthetase